MPPRSPRGSCRSRHARRIVLADGRFAPALSDFGTAAGLEILDLAALLERDPEASLALLRAPGDDADDRYALLADAFATGGVLLRVAAGCEIAEPIYLVHSRPPRAPAVHQARVVDRAPAPARASRSSSISSSLGDAAALGNLAARSHGRRRSPTSPTCGCTSTDAEAAQVETCVVRLAARSRYAQHLLALGGKVLRSDLARRARGRARSLPARRTVPGGRRAPGGPRHAGRAPRRRDGDGAGVPRHRRRPRPRRVQRPDRRARDARRARTRASRAATCC